MTWTTVIALAVVAVFSMRSVDASYGDDVSCVLRPNISTSQQKGVLNWICNGQVDCTPIQRGGSHYYPDTVRAHTEWAIEQYFTTHDPTNIASCNFGGAAQLSCPPRNWERIIGVNIGGFLVLEPWIVPSLFDQFKGKPQNETAIDEYTFTKVLGKAEATKQLTAHWNSWVQDADFAKLAKLGITHVRIPFGYWIFGDYPPFVRGIEQLDRAVSLAAKYGIKVLLDLHGVPGSQNGFDNSGRACDDKKIGFKCAVPCPPEPLWGKGNETLVNQTLDVIERLVQRYQNHSNIWGFELVNEPLLINITFLKSFYQAGYKLVRKYTSDWQVVIHDGFYPLEWRNFMTPSQGYKNVILDTHIYEAFDGNVNLTYGEHLAEACGYTQNINYMQCFELPLIVGEWSLGHDDCQHWLDGFGQTPKDKYCPTGVNRYNTTFLPEYGRRQLSAWYRGHGFFFWNFKTETAKTWNLFEATSNGWLPSPLGPFPPDLVNYCGY